MTLKKIAAYTVCGVAALTAATFTLPRHVTIERNATLTAAPAEVIALAASNSGYQTFNPYKTLDPNLQVELYGPASGVGSGFSFDSADGTGKVTISNVTDQIVEYALDLGPLGQPTQSIEAIPTADGADVIWRMEADMGFNPVFRVMGIFMDGMIGPTFELGLANLDHATA